MPKLYLMLSFIFCLHIFAFSQSDSIRLNRIASKPQKQSATFQVEKAYLHLDKPYYGAGDTIWFKAYVVSGSKHELSNISNVLNVELVNNRDSVKQNIKLLMVNGLCYGGLALSDSVKEGNYRIRAYTNWMRNFGEEYYFDKNVRIVNANIVSKIKTPEKTTMVKAVSSKKAAPNIDVQFFPEGGNLVSGMDCRVAFKATSPKGLGIAVTGIVTDEQGNRVAEFTSGKYGMGAFYLNAETGKTYKAKISDATGIESIVQLPKAVNTGYVLNVTAAGTDHIRVAAQAAGTKDAPSAAVTLVARSGGVVYYEGKSKPGSSSFIANIAKNKFPTGVVQFTLFSSIGEPLNERLLFIQNNDQLKLNMLSEKQTYAPQQKVKINLTAKNNNDQPVQGSFSVSVIDETRVPADNMNDNNILSNLLLTSDLKGYIENPAYYFASGDQQTADDLDALMLTQGYRKFIWQPVAGNQQPAMPYPADTGLTISGRLIKPGNKPVANGRITLYTMDGGFFSLDTVTNKEGQFAFRHLNFPDRMNFVVQSAEKERDRYQVSVDKDKLIAMANKNAADFFANDEMNILPFIQNSKQLYDEELRYDYNGKARMLKEVVVKDRSPKNLASPNSILKSGHADYVITAKQLMATPSAKVSLKLFGLIPGLVYNANGQLAKSTGPHAPPMAVVIDGVLNYNIDEINPRSIESIEVVRNTLIVTLKRGITDDDMTYAEDMPGYKKFSAKGFYKVREFYSPPYDTPKTNKEIADLRTTIYWNPMLQTDKDGNASFEYFNAGSKGNYKVIVEGIDDDGNIGRFVYRYKVE